MALDEAPAPACISYVLLSITSVTVLLPLMLLLAIPPTAPDLCIVILALVARPCSA